MHGISNTAYSNMAHETQHLKAPELSPTLFDIERVSKRAVSGIQEVWYAAFDMLCLVRRMCGSAG